MDAGGASAAEAAYFAEWALGAAVLAVGWEEAGELVPVADAGSMAEKIIAYATDPQRARAAGCAGRAAVTRQFSLESMTQRYRDLYDQLLGSRVARRRRKSLINQQVNADPREGI